MFDHDHPLNRVTTIAVGIVILGLGFLSISKADDILMLLVGLFLFVVGAIILAGPVAEIAVDWFSRLFSELFFSDNQLRGPQPIYSIPEARRAKGDFQGALDALEKIAEDSPKELKVYTEMIDIAVIDLADLELAGTVLEQGMNAVKKSDREALQLSYSLIISRLHARLEKAAQLQSLGESDGDSEP